MYFFPKADLTFEMGGEMNTKSVGYGPKAVLDEASATLVVNRS